MRRCDPVKLRISHAEPLRLRRILYGTGYPRTQKTPSNRFQNSSGRMGFVFLYPVQSSLLPYVQSTLFRHLFYGTKTVMIPASAAAITAMPTVPKSHFLRLASAEM